MVFHSLTKRVMINMVTVRRITGIGVFIWLVCAIVYSFEYMLRVSSNTLHDFFLASPYHMTETSFGWISAIFYITYMLMQLPAGFLIDRYGIKSVMFISTLLMTIAMAVFAQSTSDLWLFIARALAGIGGGFAFLSALKSLALWFPPRFFSMFTGLTQLFLYVGAVFAQLPLLALIHHFNGVMPVFFGLFVFSGILTLSTLLIKRHPHFKKNLRLTPAISMTQQLKQMLLLLTNRQLLLNGLYCFMIFGTTALFADLWATRYLTSVYQISKIQASIAPSLIFVGVGFFSPIWGGLASVFKNERQLMMIAAVLSVIVTLITLYYGHHLWLLYSACFLFGGMQAVHVLNFANLRHHVPAEQMGTGLAFINLFIPLSGAVLQPISMYLATFFQTFLTHDVALMATMAIVPILGVIAFFIGMLIHDTSKLEQHAETVYQS